MAADTRRIRTWPVRRSLVVVYLLLLTASHIVRRFDPWKPGAAPDQETVRLAEIDGDTRGARRVTLAYRDLQPPEASAEDRIPVLLVHGSPGSLQDFAALGRLLARERRVVIPDLPGFGASGRHLPDYSVAAHARYLHDWLDSLGVARVHAVGFSMGGGVVLQLARLDPDRVRSVTMIGAIGVQELELLGNYEMNHALHRIQWAAVWLVHEALPHFGLLDGAVLSPAFARNFTDTDQRPLRGILEQLTVPVLIVHGRHDPLVPYAAAREHHRIVPQSELVTYRDGSHFLLWTETESLTGHLDDFFGRVERGEATGRAGAPPERVAAAAVPFEDVEVPPASGMQVVILFALLMLGTFVTEDLTCITAGLLIARGRLDPAPGILACFTGIYLGDLALYLAGRLAGPALFRRRPWRWFLREATVRRAADWFDRRGMIVVLLTRFLPGSRVPAYVAAGMVRASFPRFALLFLVAVAVWTPALVGLAAWAGRGDLPWPALVGVAAGIWAAVQVGLPSLTARGRRMLRVRWRRLFAWEFWPLWLFYAPVLVRILLLAVRHRSLALVSAANPAIPEGGFVGESKFDILRGLAGDANRSGDRERIVDSRGCLAATERLPADDPKANAVRVLCFLREQGLRFPVVLKPDVGERGEGVCIVREERELERSLASVAGRPLVQEFVGGPEFGIFYARRPGDAHGRVLSVTEKRLPEVVGDGDAALEELILRDERASMIADVYFAENAGRLSFVPAAGERVRLVEIGTHCRGAVFLDGAEHRTAELVEAVDRISLAYERFFFGRYDVRTTDVETLRSGEFRVLELNGVTSEATHVYDPRHSLPRAYRDLFRQWETAFEIAAENRRRGARPATLARMLRRLGDHRRGRGA